MNVIVTVTDGATVELSENKPVVQMLYASSSSAIDINLSESPVIQLFYAAQNPIEVFTNVGSRGPKGDKGDEQNVYEFTAGMSISGGKVVYMSADKIYTYTASDEDLYRTPIGISKTSALINQPVSVQLFGLFYEAGLGLIPDKDYFAGVNGLLTTNPDGLKVTQYVGRSVSPDKIKINFQQPIITV